jgi:hypothetical protein
MTLNFPQPSQILVPKKKCLAIGISLAFLLISCTKTKLSTDDTHTNGNKRFSARNLSIDQQKQIYIVLSPSEKCAEWKNHLNEYLFSGHYSFNRTQLAFLQELRDVLSPSFFEENFTPASTQEIIDAYRDEAKLLFAKPVARNLFGSLTSVMDLRDDGPQEQYLDAAGSCNCNSMSDFCWGFSDCTVPLDKCQVRSNCGFLWKYSCDGLCI